MESVKSMLEIIGWIKGSTVINDQTRMPLPHDIKTREICAIFYRGNSSFSAGSISLFLIWFRVCDLVCPKGSSVLSYDVVIEE
jgi:hypothetical protein